jgi:hypothetical protein
MDKTELDMLIELAVKEAVCRIEKKCKGCEKMNDLRYIKRVGPLTMLMTAILALGGVGSVSYFTVTARELERHESGIVEMRAATRELKSITDTLSKNISSLEIKHDEIMVGINNIETMLEKRLK